MHARGVLKDVADRISSGNKIIVQANLIRARPYIYIEVGAKFGGNGE